MFRMPTIDDGPTDGPPGKQLKTAWVHLTVEEAVELLESLKAWEEWAHETGSPEPGWHTHLTDDDGNELTIAVGEPEVSDDVTPDAGTRC